MVLLFLWFQIRRYLNKCKGLLCFRVLVTGLCFGFGIAFVITSKRLMLLLLPLEFYHTRGRSAGFLRVRIILSLGLLSGLKQLLHHILRHFWHRMHGNQLFRSSLSILRYRLLFYLLLFIYFSRGLRNCLQLEHLL